MLHRRPFAESFVALAFAMLTSNASSGQTPAAAAPTPTDGDLNQARERFAAARGLEDGGRWAEALTVFQRVAEVRMTPQVRFHIALCLENVGLWTQALDVYAQAANEAGDAAPDVVKEANDHMRKLQASIPTITVHVAGAAPGDDLLLDRRPLPLDDPPQQIRTDPGPHTAEVWRGGALLAREFFALEPQSARQIELRLGTVAPDPGEVVHETTPPVKTQRALGWTAVGGGVASLAVMGILIGQRASALSQLDAVCPTHMQCPTSVASAVADGKTYSALTNVFGAIGGVAVAAGAVLLLTTPTAVPHARRLSPTPGTAPDPPARPVAWIELRGEGVLTLGGTF